MGQNIFDEESAVRRRIIEYGKVFDELHLVVFTPNSDKFQNQKLSNNVFLYPTKSKVRVLYFFDFLKIIRKILKNDKGEDIVLTCQDPFETGIIGALLKLFYGLPLHIQVHTDFMHKYFRKTSLLNLARFYLAEFVLRYSDRVRVVSQRVGDSISGFFKNVDVLPIKTEMRDARYKVQEKTERINILTVCRLEKEKNIEIALRAFKIVSKNFPKIIFTIVGDGKERSRLEHLSKIYNLTSKIYFVGWQENLDSYYQNADVYVSTSLYEGYGLSTVEAASFGLPLVLSDTGVAGEIFKDGESALICDAKDSECFAEAILKICKDKELTKRIGQSAKESADKHLTNQENYFKKYADSILKTVDNFQKKDFIGRLINFKLTAWKSIIFVRYFICGITAATANIGLLYIFTDIAEIWYLYSSILAFSIALIVSFTLQKFVVFKDHDTDDLHYQFTKYFIVAILGVITNTALMFACVDIFGVWYILAQIIAGFFVMIQNFILYNFFIFNK